MRRIMSERMRSVSVLFLMLLPTFGAAGWTRLVGHYTTTLALSGPDLFMGSAEGIYRLTNDGSGWSVADSGLIGQYINSVASDGFRIFAGSGGSGIFESTDRGATWRCLDSMFIHTSIRQIALKGSSVFVSTSSGAFRSTNYGESWSPLDSTFAHLDVSSIVASDTVLYVSTWGAGIFFSDNSGRSWSSRNSGLPNLLVGLVAKFDFGLLAYTHSPMDPYGGDAGGIFRSTNDGVTWIPSYTTWSDALTHILVPAVSGLTLISSTGRDLVVSTNGGVSWYRSATSSPGANFGLVAIFGSELFAETNDGVLWSRPLRDVVTSTGDATQLIPTGYILFQNYPNPFNPKTVVSYQLPVVSSVRLVVYDVLGREVAVLVNEKKVPGMYELSFDGSGLASGVYVYRLMVGDFVQSKRALLLK